MKKLAVLLIVIMMICLGFLSGCNEETKETSNPMIIYNFQVTPTSIEKGGTINMSWNITGATTVSIDNDIGFVSLNGTKIIQPTKNTIYTVTAKNVTDTITKTIGIIVKEIIPIKNNNDSKNVDILNYSVTTEWTTGCCGHFENHIEQGFYPTEKMGYGAKYVIKGEIKNIAEEDININININFLAKNSTVLFNTELLDSTYYIYKLSKEDVQSFLIEVSPELYDYYKDPIFYNQLRINFIKVKSLEFDISTIVSEKNDTQ
jgi:uncharacterized membrane-anchored protein